MCGIWAFLQQGETKKDDCYNVGKAFHDFFSLTHRGPDHSHFEAFSSGLLLGFHRLAIMNPSLTGNQPFKKQDATHTAILVCNGEIYNYKELIAEFGLEPSENDCYVLLDLYWTMRQEGRAEEFIRIVKEHVKGEYAFLLFEMDEAQRVSSVIAARDAVGVRPLYVSTAASVKEHGLLFSSELKGALMYPGEVCEFPPGHLRWYRFPITTATVAVETVEEHVTHSLYDPVDSVKEEEQKEEKKEEQKQLLDNLHDSICRSVERRLYADRPIAFLTSGGIDSSLVTALSARLSGKKVRTFCCSITEGGIAVGRDVEYAREVSEWIGSDHTEVLFTKEEALAAIPDVIRTVESWDTTTVRASVGQYLVCRWIGQNTDCKVVLVGEGPDEVCSSYLFNWYAPSGQALDQSARDYVRRIHLYDGRRADRCIARWGLEARVPFLDPEFIRAYWDIPAEQRMPKTKGIEKWWLREAFKDDILPERVRLRMKDAFSDSISGQVSWTQMIQEWVKDKVTDEELAHASKRFPWCTPQTKEAYYYRQLFCQTFGERMQSVLPGYWQPQWSAEGKVSGYVDPSARTLGIYQELS